MTAGPRYIGTMDLNFQHRYRGTTDAVVELMRTDAFIADVAEHAGSTAHSVRIEDNVTHLDMSLAAPPSIAKVVGAHIRMSMAISWGPADAQGVHTGSVDVKVHGAPVTVNAAGRLQPSGQDACMGDFRGTLDVRIPLVGRRIEAQVAPMITEAFAGIERRANHWLTREQ